MDTSRSRLAEWNEALLTSAAAGEQGRSSLASGGYRDAAGSYRAALAKTVGYTLQLEIVCQDSSIKEGFAAAQGGDYFILPYTFRGRSCYRAFWGVFPSKAAAASAEKSVPAFFRNQLHGRQLPIVPLAAVR